MLEVIGLMANDAEQKTVEWLLERFGASLEKVAKEWIEIHEEELSRRRRVEESGLRVSWRFQSPSWTYLPQALKDKINELQADKSKEFKKAKINSSVLDVFWCSGLLLTIYLFVIVTDARNGIFGFLLNIQTDIQVHIISTLAIWAVFFIGRTLVAVKYGWNKFPDEVVIGLIMILIALSVGWKIASCNVFQTCPKKFQGEALLKNCVSVPDRNGIAVECD